MLKMLKIYNNSGISEEIKINFTKSKATFKEKYIQGDIINPAVLFGKNGTGKTSILKSLFNIERIMNDNLAENNKFVVKNELYNSEETTIELTCVLFDVTYDYSISIVSGDQIINESLKVDGKIYSREVFDILAPNYSMIRYIGHENLNHPFTILFKYLSNITYVNVDKQVVTKYSFKKLLDLHGDKLLSAGKLFSDVMDLAISYDLNKEKMIAEYKGVELDYYTMLSAGTRDFYEMLALIFELPRGSLLVVDEIEKTFHSDLLSQVIDYINQEFDIQIICSSHNTNFMKRLRPDQLFITKKSNDIVSVDRISDIHPAIREIHNLEKLYMGGKFE